MLSTVMSVYAPMCVGVDVPMLSTTRFLGHEHLIRLHSPFVWSCDLHRTGT